ncbi:MAG: hypothetical protein VX941_00880 [Pseudomonadota bacterium]|nr:hypothetical protein [Pseudomonadota bacterium]
MLSLFISKSPVNAEAIKVEITPAPIAVNPGQTVKLGANLSNLPPNARLSWSIDAVGVAEAQKGRLSRDFQPTYTAPQIAPKKPIFIQILAFIDGVPVAGAKSKIIFVASGGGEKKGKLNNESGSARQGEPVQGDKPGLKGGSSGQASSGQKGEPKKIGQLEAKTRLMQKGEQGQKGASGKRGKAKGSNVPVKNNDLGQKDESSHIDKSGEMGSGQSKGQSEKKDIINWTVPPPPDPINSGKIIWNIDPGRNRSGSCVLPSCGQSGPSAPPEPPPLLAPEQWN